ncbi:MAG: hypothetical protein ACTHOF_16670 [Flavisolibacter sp.]
MATTTTLSQTMAASYTEKETSVSVFKKFMNWCKEQDENRFMWVGIALAGHGCVLTPLTVMAVVFAGTNMFLFMLAIVAMGMALVTNLAAMPTKITIPVFILSIVIDIAIVFTCIGMVLTN